jgi:hypothetical protein
VITFTEQDALNGLRQAVSGRGASYIYPQGRCIYVTAMNGDLEPSCMVGYALGCMGVPLSLIYHSFCNTNAFPSLAIYLSRYHDYHFTPGAIKVLNAAQAVQDKGTSLCWCPTCTEQAARQNTWGEALAAAVAVAQRSATETSIDVAANDVIAAAEALTTDAALATV